MKSEPIKIRCRFKYKVYEKGTLMIYSYSAESPVVLPDGSKHTTFTVKGYLLPEIKELDVILSGNWEIYKNKKSNESNYTFAVTDYEEIRPDQRTGIIAYLQTLQGVGKKTAERLYDSFGSSIFDVIENNPGKLSSLKGISKKKIQLITISYGKRKYAKELFQYLFPFHIKDSRILRIHKMWGADALPMIKENPYILTNIYGIGFDTADTIARKEGLPKDFIPRIEAGIVEVLTQSENGGPLFSSKLAFPEFVKNAFLTEPLFKLMLNEDLCNITGSTYLPRDIAYLMTLKLLEIPLSEQLFDQIAVSLHTSKRIFIAVDRTLENDQVKFYRYHIAKAEYSSAKKLALLMKAKLDKIDDIDIKINDAQRKLQIRMSDEQISAVKMALSNPVSVITGGPGTGKTSIQKGILSVFKTVYPESEILLAAPTGRAAKKMNESTGDPVSTLHKALNLYAGENGEAIEASDDFIFSEKLIIVDECSMLGSLLFDTLLSHIKEGTRLVMIGDVDQLPSIEVGAVLKELINSEVVPVTKLTKTFRQASGSNIAVNASRIKHGQHEMAYGEDFCMYEVFSSHEIAETAAHLYPALVNEYGIDNVICLSSYRKSTESGANNLNNLLRTAIRSDITEATPYYERKGIRYYVGDRIMFTRNTEELTNGDIGEITDIKKGKDMLQVTCVFDGQKVVIEDDDVSYIDLALSMTVHKSQGSEYPVVLMICDMAHKILLKRNLIYTGITRAKHKIILLGQREAFDFAVDVIDSNFRRSQLGHLLKVYLTGKKEKKTPKVSEKQLKFAI